MKTLSLFVLLGIGLLSHIPAHAVSFEETLAEIAALSDDLTKKATLAISPGTDFDIDGQRVQVFGNEPCPNPNKVVVYYIGKPASGMGCAVITPKTNSIIVQRKTDTGLKPEVWRVEHKEDAIALWTKDGKSVLP